MGKDITICQTAGILYIISQRKKKNKHEIYITQNQTDATSKSWKGCRRNGRLLCCFNQRSKNHCKKSELKGNVFPLLETKDI